MKRILLLIIVTLSGINGYGQILWSTSGSGGAWLSTSNWTGGVVPGTTGYAQFQVNPTGGGQVGINLNGSTNNGSNNQAVGGIEMSGSRTTFLVIGNSSTTASGTLTLNGTTINSIANTVLRNTTAFVFNLNNNTAGGNKNMGIALNNVTDNKIYIEGIGDISISCIISGIGKLTKEGTGAGVLTLTTGNTYTGKTFINGGLISTSGESAFGANPGSFTADQITLNGGGIASSVGSITFSSNRGITLGTSGGTFYTNGNPITLSNVVTGSGGLTKTGTDILNFNAVHTYFGATTISAGTLKLSAAGTFPDASALTISSGATFDLNNKNETIGSLAGAGTVTSTASGSMTLTTANNTSTTFSGVIQNGSGTSVAFTKGGTGTFTLSGNNTYTGNTTITGGKIELSAADRIANTSNMVLNGGTFSTGAATGFNETVGTLAVTGVSTIALGTGSHTLTFSNSSAVSWTGGTLTVTGWTGTGGVSGTAGKIFFGATTGTLTAGQLAQISFAGFPGTPILLGTGELVPPAPIYWDVTAGAANGVGGSGTWGTTFSASSAGSASLQAATSTDNTAFNATAGTVNLAASQTVGSIVLGVSGYTFVTSGVGARTLTAPFNLSTYNVSFAPISGADFSLPSVISGSGNIIHSGTGNTVLATSNTYTGTTTITSGYINTTGESAFGTNPGGFTAAQITLNGGGIQTGSGDISFNSNRGITLGASGGTFDVSATRTITLTNVVTGTGVLTKTSSTGTLLLDGAHTYTGTTTVNGGILRLNKTGGGTLPSTNNMVVNNGGTIRVSTTQTINNLTIASGGTLVVDAGVTLTINGTYAVSQSNSGGGSGTIAMGAGSTLQINEGGWPGNTNTFTYNATATLVFNNTSGPYSIGSGDTWWPSSNGPYNVTVQGGGGITMNSISRTVPTTGTTGTFLLVSGTNAVQGTALTLNGTVQINGGNFQTTPTYGGSSLLIYNITYGTSNEWTGGATTAVAAGSGVPANVTVQTGTLTLAGGRGLPGNLQVNAACGMVLNSTSGDLYIGGNLTNNGSTWTNNNRAVFFVGTGTSVISASSSIQFFDYFIIQKTSGSVQLSSTDVTLNTTTGNVLQILAAGTLDLNGRALNFNNTNGNIYVDGARQITTSLAGAAININGNKAIINNAGTGTLSLGTNITVNLNNASLNFGSSITTLAHILSINSGGFVQSNPPIYQSTSTLIYNTGGAFGNGSEWTAGGVNTLTSGSGIPGNVTIQTTSTNVTLTGNRGLSGLLTVSNGATLTLGGGDLYTKGNLSFTGTGALVGGSKAIFFCNNASIQTISSAAALTIPYFVFSPASGNTTVQLLSNLSVSAPSTGNAISFNGASDVLDLNGNSLNIGTTATANTISGAGTFKGSTSSNLTLLGTGNIGTLNFTTSFQNLGTLTLNRTSGGAATLGTSLTINTALTLTSGLLTLGSNNITLAAAANATGSSTAFVVADGSGEFRKTYSASGSFTFPVGDNSVPDGPQYSPATLNFTSGTFAGYASVRVTDLVHPNNLAPTDYITRYWTTGVSGIAGFSCDASFVYDNADIVGTEANLDGGRYNGATWIIGNAANTGINTLSINAQTSLSNAFSGGRPLNGSTFISTTGTYGPYCNTSSNSVTVTFTYTLASNFPSSTFTAQLSDASGSFASPTNIGTVASNASGSQSISATIPASQAAGTAYRIRAVSNTPAVNGADNGSNITVNETATPTPGSNTPVCVGSPLTLSASTVSGATYNWTGPNTYTSSTQNPIVSASATLAMAGSYIITATANSCTSPSANTTVTINTQPADPTGSITVSANPSCGAATLSYTTGYYWQTSASGTSTAFPTSSNYTLSSTGTIYVRNYNGTCWSNGTVNTGTVTINTTPAIGTNPTNVSVTAPASASFSISSVTGSVAGYQWQLSMDNGSTWNDISNGAPYSNATTASLTINPTSASYNSYQYRCKAIGSSPCGIATSTAATLSVIWEDFETGSKGSYTIANVTCTAGSWSMNDALIGTSGSDIKNGSQSVRMRNTGDITMNFNRTSGIGTVNVNHAKYSGDGNSTWRLDASTDGGSTWTAYASSTITTSSTSLVSQLFTLNLAGNVRFRIVKLSGASNRINFDDISLTDYAGCTVPSSQASSVNFASLTGIGLDVNWTNGNGAGRVVKMNSSNSFTTPTMGSNPTASLAWANAGEQVVYNGTGSGPISISGLTPGTTYYFRVYEYCNPDRIYQSATASNNPNSQSTPAFPTVSTTAVTTITNTLASSGGNVTADGGNSVTARGVVWDATLNPTLPGLGSTSNGTGLGSYTSSLTTLNPETQYHVRAYATNVNGAGYGSDLSFYTLSNPVDLQAANLIANATSSVQVDLSWDAAVFPSSGATVKGYVLIRATNPSIPTFTATNGNAPTAGVGTIISSTIIDPTNTFSNNGLAGNTTYNYLLVPYCWDGTQPETYNYLTSGALTATATTPPGSCTPPVTSVSTVSGILATSNSFLINWTAGSGDRTLVIVKQGSATTTTPANGTSYSANNTFGLGNIMATLEYVCYDGTGTSFTLSGLSASTTYHYTVYTYNSAGVCYKTPGVNQNTTTLAAPSVIETFEPGTKATYANGNNVCALGNWNLNDALIGTSANDKKVGARSARIQNSGSLTMLFDKTNGLGTVTIQHAKYGTDANSTWRMDVSDNGGATYTAFTSSIITTSSTTLTTATFNPNLTGNNIRIRIIKLSGGGARLNIDQISLGDFVSGNTITTGVISGSPFCISNLIGISVSVPFTSTGAFNSANVYTAQLSDASGSFSIPTDIGTLSSNANTGTISATIPAGTLTGALYRIRVVASDPVIVGAQNVSNLSIYLNTPDVSGFNAGITGATTLTLNWTNPTACFDEILIVGKASTAVTVSPTGNGSLYTANAAFGTGGSGANLPANEYGVFKASSGTSVSLSGLTTGTVYFFEIFLRKGTIWSDGIILTATPIAVQVGDFRSIVGSNLPYTSASTWQTWNGSSWVAASTYPNSVSVIPPLVSATIQSGSTVILNSSVTNDPIKNLTVNSGGKLFTNNSTYNGNRYITVYGDITCNGTIGNGLNVYDNISFNIEGNPTTISGTGSFDGSRIRKNFTTNSTTTLIIAMNLGLKFASGISNSSGTVLYNNSSSTFNMTLNENSTLNLFTDVGESGNISIDGIDGEGSGERGGTFTVNGILNVPGTLFAFTDNATRPINYTIGTSGVINCVNVCTGNSASSNTAVQNGSDAAGATLRILNGGKLNMTGGVASNTNTYNKPFSKRNNNISPYAYVAGLGTSNQTYDLQAGSFVEYSSATGTMPMQSQTLIYSNLLITGAATKTINSTLNVNKDITIESPAIFNCSGNNINIGGDWNNYGTTGFTEGSSASITFNGTSKQNIICASTEDFYNVNISNSTAQGVELACNLNIANDLDLGSNGRLFFGTTPSILSLTKMTASSNTFKGTSTALLDMGSAEHTLNIGCESPSYAGTFNSGTLSLVNYNRDNAFSGSTGDQDILTSLTYANLSFSGSDNKKTNNNFTVNSSMVVDGSSTVLKANTIGKTLTLAGNLTLSGGATMDDNCRDNLEIITSGVALQTFNGNFKTIKSFNLKSTKNAGGLTLTGPSGTTNCNIKNDIAIDFTGAAIFTDNADTLKIGDDIELGSASSNFSNFNFTGTFITTGIGAASDIHLSDIATTGVLKAELNHLVIDAGANSSPLNQVEIYPIAGASNIVLKGNLEIINGTNGSELDANDNTVKIAGNWLSYNANAFKQGNNSTVEWNGTTLQTLTCAGGEIFTNLTLNNNSLGLIINNSISVNKTLQLTNGKINLNGNNLTLGTNTSNAVVNGGSATSYVIGWNGAVNGNIIHRVNSNGNYKFPIGDNTSGGYTPADVTFTTGLYSNATLTCYLNDGIQADLLNPTASTNYLSRYWTIEQTGVTNFYYDINYSYADAGDEVGVAANMWPYKHNTQGWITCWGATANPGTFKQGAGSFNPGTKTFNWSGLTTFSEFTGNGNGSPLPISLIEFTATPENDVVKIEWSTLSETNNDFYTVERSKDGKNFDPIYKLSCSGNSNSYKKYATYDNDPYYGLSYYRLKQTDLDGKFTYSTLRPVNFNRGAIIDEIKITNHLNEFLLVNFNYMEPQDVQIYITTIDGKIISNEYYSQLKVHEVQIPLGQFSNGIYLISVIGNEVFNKKFSISK